MLETKKRKAIDIIHKYEIVVNNDRLSTSELAKKYQVADSTISTIKKNKASIIKTSELSKIDDLQDFLSINTTYLQQSINKYFSK